MKVAFYTLGCKVNLYESEALKNMFLERGFKLVSYQEAADVFVVNTCTVTNQSAAKSRKSIRRAIRQNPDAVVAVIGCYSQMEKETVDAIPGVDIVMGTIRREKLIEHVESLLKERRKIVDVQNVRRYKGFDALNVSTFADKTRAFVKIQDGCNQYCSFCIIPYARGPVRSRNKDDILEEIRGLIQNGYQEIVLSGIHTGGYGTDLKNYSFYDLLEEISALDGLKRLRISSMEINQIDRNILRLMRERDVFARHLHIPLQHGANSVLKRMKRRYDVETFEDALKRIRSALPGLAITTDVIAGYPGESEEEFETMVKTLERLRFSELHVFPFSPRSGTKAAEEKGHIHGHVKSKRVETLLALNETLAKTYREETLKENRPLDLLVETCDCGRGEGHTSEYIRVSLPLRGCRENTWHTVKLTDASYPVASAQTPTDR